MVPDQVALEEMVIRMLGSDRVDRQRKQRSELDFDRLWNQRVEQVRSAGRSPARGLATARWQPNDFTLVKFEQQRPGSHVLELPGGITPIPLLGQRQGNPPAAPSRIGLDQACDVSYIRSRNQAPLNDLRFKHAGSLPHVIFRVQWQSQTSFWVIGRSQET